MIFSNILLDAHIAEQMGASFAEKKAFIISKHVLQEHNNSSSLKIAALHELGHLPSWAKIESLALICMNLRRSNARFSEAAMSLIIQPVLEKYDSAVAKSLNQVVLTLASHDIEETLNALEKVITRLLYQANSPRNLTSDLWTKKYQDVLVILAAIEVLVAEDLAKVAEFLEKDSTNRSDTSAISLLLDRSLTMEFGRNQQLMAVDCLIHLDDLRRAGQVLKSIPQGIQTNPNILVRHAALVMRSSAESPADWTKKELITYTGLINTLGEYFYQLAPEQKRQVLGVWQDAILHNMLSAIDEPEGQSIVDMFGILFRPRLQPIPQFPMINMPVYITDIGRTRGPIYSLLLRETGEFVEHVRFGQGFDAHLVVAPWYHLNIQPRKVGPKGVPRASFLVRMSAWAIAADRIIRSINKPDVEDKNLRSISTFLLHAYYWMNRYYRTIPQSKKSNPTSDEQLILIASSIIQQTLGGRFDSPSPHFFANTVHWWIENGFDSENGMPADEKRSEIERSSMFGAIFQLIQNAITITETEYRYGRWFEVAGKLANVYLSLDEETDQATNYTAALIAREFGNSSPDVTSDINNDVENIFNEVKQIASWKPALKKHRVVLLADTKYYKYWNIANIEKIDAQDKDGLAGLLSLLTQLIAVAHQDSSVDEEIKERWYGKFREILVQAKDFSDFDRFLQLRLVELLRQGAFYNANLKDKCELNGLILMLVTKLLEFGASLTFNRLQEWLMEDLPKKEGDGNLRLVIFETISKYIDFLQSPALVDEQAMDLFGREQAHARAKSLERFKACSLVAETGGSFGLSQPILQGARDIQKQIVCKTNTQYAIQGYFEYNEHGRLVPISAIPDFNTQTSEIILPSVRDASFTATCFPQKGILGLNLFARAKKNLSEPSKYVGILASRDLTEANIALNQYVVAQAHEAVNKDLSPGSLVSVTHSRPSNSDFGIVHDVQEVSALNHVSIVDSQIMFETSDDAFNVRLMSNTPDGSEKVNLTEFTSNFLFLFSKQALSLSPYNARLDWNIETQAYAEVIGTFSDLLIDVGAKGDIAAPFVLCLHSIELGPKGSPSHLIVETEPLKLFRINIWYDFSASDEHELREKLSQTINTSGSDELANGLLIAVNVVVETEEKYYGRGVGPKLVLSHATDGVSVAWHETPIHSPFDERNLTWRSIFDPISDESESSVINLPVAKTKKGALLAELPEEKRVTGFPGHVAIDLIEPNDNVNLFGVEVDFSRKGDPYSGQVRAAPTQTHKLDFSNSDPKCRIDFLTWLIEADNYHPERLLTLQRLLSNGISPYGSVSGFTEENLFVSIYAESLTLKPLPDKLNQSFFRSIKGRKLVARPKCGRHIKININNPHLPEAAFANDCAVGIIVEVAANKSSDFNDKVRECSVAWQHLLDKEPSKITLSSAKEELGYLPQGSRIRINRHDNNGGSNGTLEILSVHAEAIWKEVPHDERHQYAGTAQQRDGSQIDLCEANPGTFSIGPELTSEQSESAIVDISKGKCQLITPKRASALRFRGRATSRITLEINKSGSRGINNKFHLTGVTEVQNISPVKVKLAQVALELIKSKFQGYQYVRRLLHVQKYKDHELSSSRYEKKTFQKINQAEGSLDDLQSIMGTDIEGLYEYGIFIPSDIKLRRKIPNGISLQPNEMSYLSPYDEVAAYSRRKQARLHILPIDQPLGSFKKTQPGKLEELSRELDDPRLGEKITLNNLKLYYVGTNQAESRQHVLEWGYGYWLSLEPEQIYFCGSPLIPTHLSIAFGDCIRKLQFEQQNDRLTLNILEVDHSATRILFEQSSKKRINHLVHVTLNPGRDNREDLKITKVEGYDGSRHNSTLNAFRSVRPKLAVKTAQALQKMLTEKIKRSGDPETIIINAKVDAERFNQTFGRELVYEAVRIGEQPMDGFRSLEEGDMIFVRAGKINEGKNDVYLSVSPLSNVNNQLVDPQLYNPRVDKMLNLPRRQFSYDEYKLMHLQKTNASILEGSTLLVKVTKARANQINLSLVKGAIPRRSNILDGLMARQDHHLLGIFVKFKKEDDSIFIVELRPGILIEINRSEVYLPSGVENGLMKGDLLAFRRRRSQKANRKYQIALAMHGDHHYVSNHRRPVVTLPTNALSRKDAMMGSQQATLKLLHSFSVGDFRQTIAKLNSKQHPREELANFMAIEHPKLAWLIGNKKINKNNGLELILTSDQDYQILAGRLVIDSNNEHVSPNEYVYPKVKISPFHKWGTELSRLSSDWFDITYAYGSAQDIAKRLSTQQWSYHDEHSFTWKQRGNNEYQVVSHELPQHNVEMGPLFFRQHGKTASLRLPVGGQFRQYVLSFANLKDQLPETNTNNWAHMIVAGHAGEYGLIVESLPGRFFELSGSLTQHDVSEPIALDSLDWQTFGIGDVLKVSRKPNESDPFMQETVAIDWQHGVQNAFGAQGAILKKISLDEIKGCVAYGAREIVLDIPCNEPKSMPDIIVAGGYLTPKPFYKPTEEEKLDAFHKFLVGRTILLVSDEEGGLTISGLDEYTPCLASQTHDGTAISWQRDSLLMAFSDEKQEGSDVLPTMELVSRVIKGVGGVLPVTIESIDKSKNNYMLYFSRRLQIPLCRNETIARATILDLSDDAQNVILCVGGRHLVVPSRQFVNGAPDELLHLMVKQLADKRHSVWVQLTSDGYRIGLPSESQKMISVRGVDIIAENPNEAATELVIHGVVCQEASSHCLYWLPYHKLGAAELTFDEINQHFLKTKIYYDVKLLPSKAVSVVDYPLVSTEINKLRLGTRLELSLVGEVNNEPCQVLAKTVNSGLLLRINIPAEKHRPDVSDGLVLAEISQRNITSNGMLILNAGLLGHVALRSDLPVQIASIPKKCIELDNPIVFGASLEPELLNPIMLGDECISSAEETVILVDEFLNKKVISLRSSLGLLEILLGALEQNQSPILYATAWKFGQEIYLRSLRSIHLEPISRYQAQIHRNYQPEEFGFDVSSRVREIIKTYKKKQNVFELNQMLEGLIRFVSLYPTSKKGEAIAYAISVAFGNRHDLGYLAENAPILQMCINVTRLFSIDVANKKNVVECDVVPLIRDKIIKIKHEMLDEDLDIPLPIGFHFLQTSNDS